MHASARRDTLAVCDGALWLCGVVAQIQLFVAREEHARAIGGDRIPRICTISTTEFRAGVRRAPAFVRGQHADQAQPFARRRGAQSTRTAVVLWWGFLLRSAPPEMRAATCLASAVAERNSGPQMSDGGHGPPTPPMCDILNPNGSGGLAVSSAKPSLAVTSGVKVWLSTSLRNAVCSEAASDRQGCAAPPAERQVTNAPNGCTTALERSSLKKRYSLPGADAAIGRFEVGQRQVVRTPARGGTIGEDLDVVGVALRRRFGRSVRDVGERVRHLQTLGSGHRRLVLGRSAPAARRACPAGETISHRR